MKRCLRCEREIPESATECGHCDDLTLAGFSPDDLALLGFSRDDLPVATPIAPSAWPARATTEEAAITAAALDPVKLAPIHVIPAAAAEVASAPEEFRPVVSPPEPPQVEVPLAVLAPATIPLPTPLPPPTPVAAKRTNRSVMLAGLLVVAGGTLAFAMLRTSAPPAVPVLTPAAAVPPAAPKPAVTPVTAPPVAAATSPAPAAATPPAPSAPATTPAVAPAPIAAVPTPAPSPAPTPTASPAPPPARVAAAAPAPAATVLASKWNAANREWLANGRKGVAFELPSLKKVTIWQGISQPMLVVRCDAGHMQAFVYTASALQMEVQDENHSVRFSFDGEPEASERWADSSDHDALFAPDGVAFAHRVATAQTLRFGYTPHNAPRAVAEFQVNGLADLLRPAAKQCGWK